MLLKKLFLIAISSTAVLGSVHAQTMQQDSAPQVDVAAMDAANMQPAVKPIKKAIKKPVAKHKSAIKRSSKKTAVHLAECDPKPEVVTCTMPTKP